MSLTYIIVMTILLTILVVLISSLALEANYMMSSDCIWATLSLAVIFTIILVMFFAGLSVASPRFGLANIRYARNKIEKYEKVLERAQDEEERIMYKKKIANQERIVSAYIETFFKEKEISTERKLLIRNDTED